MTIQTRSQRMAHAAFPRIRQRKERLKEKEFKEYNSFARKFPALIHTCGLAQAIAFALAKQEGDYIDDLATVLRESGHLEIADAMALQKQTQTQPLNGYLRLSRDAISAAGWLKRYVEAFGEAD